MEWIKQGWGGVCAGGGPVLVLERGRVRRGRYGEQNKYLAWQPAISYPVITIASCNPIQLQEGCACLINHLYRI